MDGVHRHWIERLADKVEQAKKPPFVITAGITTSGPAHLGTVCEFLYPAKLCDELKKRGYETKFFFFADILDAFDNIPSPLKHYEDILSPHLGKPLCNVPDPTGKAKSLGEYFFAEVEHLMDLFDVHPEIKKMNEVYKSGIFDEITRFFILKKDEAAKVLEEVSGRQISKDWFPIQTICANCGKIATTRITSFDEETGEYTYVCDKDVGYTKGCGFEGKAKIEEHNYKLVWRLHWPAWLKVFGTCAEGAGADHHTKGGSWDTTVAIFKRILHEQPPIGFKFGFIMFNGKKYSKSKGIGIGAVEATKLVPPSVIAYVLLVPDVEQNKDIPLNQEGLLRIVEQYERASEIYERMQEGQELTRAERKMAVAYRLAGKRKWRCSFRDAIMHFTIFKDWNIVASKLNDAEGIAYISSFIEEWMKKDYIPENLNFSYNPRKAEGLTKDFFSSLSPEMSALEIHNFVFQFSSSHGIEPKEMFKNIYQTLIGKDRGPRVGKLIAALGVERVKKDVL